MGTGIVSLLWIIPLLVLLASLMGLSYLWYRVFKSRACGDLPTCGKCGYAVRGLSGLSCPECGADLREVGIVTPKRRGTVSPAVFVLLWTLLLPGPSCVVSGLLVEVGPHTTTTTQSIRIEPVISGEYQRIDININATRQKPYRKADVTLLGNAGQVEHIRVDLTAMRYANTGSTPHPPQPLDASALLMLLKNIGADTTQQHVGDEASELLTLLQRSGTSGNIGQPLTHFSLLGSATSSFARPTSLYASLLLVSWPVVWIGGFVVYFRIRWKKLRVPPPSPEPAPPSQPAD